MTRWSVHSRTALSYLIFGMLVWSWVSAGAANIIIVNEDGPGEGFNDNTAATPVGGNPGTTVGEQRLNVFQRAAEIWTATLDSSVDVHVAAAFNPLSCSSSSGTLGSAGPSTVHRDFTGAPQATTWYPAALANSLAGTDLDPNQVEISATFNSEVGKTGCLESLSWYYGLDNNPPAGSINLLDTILHEFAHGLGFITFVSLTNGQKFLGYDDTYMRNLVDVGNGKDFPEMNNSQRLDAITSTGDLQWDGANVVASSGFLTDGRNTSNGQVEIYAPDPVEQGSSVSHFSNDLAPNELMEPFATSSPDSALTTALFQDIGWSLKASAPMMVADTSSITVESCTPTNGYIDPDETVTIDFTLRNAGSEDTSNVVATLQASGSVTSPSSPQDYGALAAGEPGATQPFTFTASGICGGTLTATFQLQDGAEDLGTVAFTFELGEPIETFSEDFDSVSAPSIPSGWTTVETEGGTPWVTSTTWTDTSPNAAFATEPTVVGDNRFTSPTYAITGSAARLSFRQYYDLETGTVGGAPTMWAFDGSVLEISIDGGSFADIITAGGSFVQNGYNYTVHSSYGNPLAGRDSWSGFSSGLITTVVNLPSSTAGKDVQFRWRLGTDTGTGGNGWYIDSISIQDGYDCCQPEADLTLTQTDNPDPSAAGYELTYTLTVSNNGPESATNVVLTDTLPGDVTFVSATASQGSCSESSGVVTCNLGTIANSANATATIVVSPNNGGSNPVVYSISNGASVALTEIDPNSADNSASIDTDIQADNDTDGLPDGYETTNGLDANNSADGAIDTDGDGYTNLDEYLSGTDLNDSTETSGITTTSISGNDVIINFNTISGKNCRVEWSPDFPGSTWNEVTTIVGDGTEMQVTDFGAAAGAQRFYRIVILP